MASPEGPRPPKVWVPELHGLTPGDAGDLEPREDVEGLSLHEVDLGGVDLEGVGLLGCELVSVRSGEVAMPGSHMSEVRLERIEAAAWSAPRCGITAVSAAASRVGALDLHECEIRDLTVEDCRLDWVSLRGARMRDVIVRGCHLGELDLGGATLERIAFEACTVETVRAGRARMRDVDLRGLGIGRIHGAEGMRGAWVSGDQVLDMARDLATQMGIRILD